MHSSFEKLRAGDFESVIPYQKMAPPEAVRGATLSVVLSKSRTIRSVHLDFLTGGEQYQNMRNSKKDFLSSFTELFLFERVT